MESSLVLDNKNAYLFNNVELVQVNLQITTFYNTIGEVFII